MEPKEIRSKILHAVYEYRGDPFGAATDIIIENFKNDGVTEDELAREVDYLERKYLVETKARNTGDGMNYSAVVITADGIDLVENPEEFGKLFSFSVHQNSFGDISGSNISINSSHVEQLINLQDLEVRKKIEELQKAVEAKDPSRIKKAVSYLADKALDVLIAIILRGTSWSSK